MTTGAARLCPVSAAAYATPAAATCRRDHSRNRNAIHRSKTNCNPRNNGGLSPSTRPAIAAACSDPSSPAKAASRCRCLSVCAAVACPLTANPPACPVLRVAVNGDSRCAQWATHRPPRPRRRQCGPPLHSRLRPLHLRLHRPWWRPAAQAPAGTQPAAGGLQRVAASPAASQHGQPGAFVHHQPYGPPTACERVAETSRRLAAGKRRKTFTCGDVCWLRPLGDTPQPPQQVRLGMRVRMGTLCWCVRMD